MTTPPKAVNERCSSIEGLRSVNTRKWVQYIYIYIYMQSNFEEVFSMEHLLDCAEKCLRGVSWKQSTQSFGLDILQWTAGLHRALLRGRYRSRGFESFQIHERGKTRDILSVHISERCVQKCLVNYALKPIILPKLIYDNSATIEDKGVDFALNRLRQHLARHVRKYGREGGIATIDYHNYFGCIRHDLLIDMLDDIIEDDRVFELARYFIECFPGDCGIGLGSEISQICAVYYPNRIDHYMKDRLGIHGYARYMDDSYIISNDVDELREYLHIFKELSEGMGLEINEKVTHISRFEKDTFSFLKKRIFISDSGRIVMRLERDNITRRRRMLKRQNRLLDRGEITQDAIDRSFGCWRGYAEKYDSHKSVNNMRKLLRTDP